MHVATFNNNARMNDFFSFLVGHAHPSFAKAVLQKDATVVSIGWIEKNFL